MTKLANWQINALGEWLSATVKSGDKMTRPRLEIRSRTMTINDGLLLGIEIVTRHMQPGTRNHVP